jgi:type II secretory pathway pseudopilin PulG
LIELLIVVAIIAILAAIAVPNFLEAQMRSKISRVRADQRTLATAIESYHVDRNAYMPYDTWGNHQNLRYWTALTSPIAYVASIPSDVFFDPDIHGDYDGQVQYGYYAHGDGTNYFVSFIEPRLKKYTEISDTSQYLITSAGPDFYLNLDGSQVAAVEGNNSKTDLLPYDPTNGTVSKGDIMRFGP